jgi:putative peptidoglycan lipid II flippase
MPSSWRYLFSASLLIFADVFDSISVPNLVSARLKGEEEFKSLAGLLFFFTLILSFQVLNWLKPVF